MIWFLSTFGVCPNSSYAKWLKERKKIGMCSLAAGIMEICQNAKYSIFLLPFDRNRWVGMSGTKIVHI